MKNTQAAFIFLFIFGMTHFPSSLLGSMIVHHTVKSITDALSPTAWELRKTRRILKEMGRDPGYLNREFPEVDINELALAVNDPAQILTINKVLGSRGGTFDNIRDWEIYEDFFYAVFDPGNRRQADSLFDVLKQHVDDYVKGTEEAQKVVAGPDFDFFEEVETLKENRKNIVIEEWINQTEYVEEGLSEHFAKFRLVDFVAVVVSRFDRIAQSASVSVNDTPRLLRRYLSRVAVEKTNDEKILAVFSSPSYRPLKGETHDFLVSKVLENEEALNDAQVLLKIWRYPGTKRGETRNRLGEAILEKKRSLNSESDLADNRLFFEALFTAAKENRGFSRFLTTLYN